MGYTIAQKIMINHLVDGELRQGNRIGIRIDQTLTQDATGTMAYLEFEAMGLNRVKTELSVAYIDHNTLQTGFENADDHAFIRSAAKKFGLLYSRPGNGICHQVHLERFGIPGKTLLGSDSHTPTGGGLGMLAIGAGGMDVAVAMGGGAYTLVVPKLVNIVLSGRLRPFVSAKDVILEILRIFTVKGGVGKIIEYSGEGVKTLSVPQRATITNMGAELGATTSVFPSDEITLAFLKAQNREQDWIELSADSDAVYDETIEINLSEIKPSAAKPHSPDNVETVEKIGKIKVDQVLIGSCTNSSYTDMMTVATILKGRTVCPTVSLGIAPGSKQVLTMLAQNGALADLIASGARILESACGPCIGMGQSPNSGGVSLRTFNRNFEGRSGTKDAQVYLVSPETAAYSAITGVLSDPTELKSDPRIEMPRQFFVDDNMIEKPENEKDAEKLSTVKGPNIKALPKAVPIPDSLNAAVALKVGDNITTDHIMPAGAKILPFRSNIPKMSEFCFSQVDPEFPKRAKELGESIILGGHNYGQGSSREHAALAPLYLGVKAVLAKSFARMHRDNLINCGILPLEFADPEDYDQISQGDILSFPDLKRQLLAGLPLVMTRAGKRTAVFKPSFTPRELALLTDGGLLNHTSKVRR